MESRPCVTVLRALRTLGQLTEIFGSVRDDIVVQLEHDSAGGLAVNGNIKLIQFSVMTVREKMQRKAHIWVRHGEKGEGGVRDLWAVYKVGDDQSDSGVIGH